MQRNLEEEEKSPSHFLSVAASFQLCNWLMNLFDIAQNKKKKKP